MKQATAVRLLILGLPLGLVLTSVASLVWHFNRPPDEEAPQVFTRLADEISEKSVAAFIRNLSEVIGPRHASAPETLERAANYLESTLGPRNIGYDVARQEFTFGDKAAVNLWVEIPGGKRRNECVLLTAHYDAPQGRAGANDNASAVAALLALAENFTMETPVLTVRLALLTNGTAPFAGTSDSGAYHFAELLKRQGDQVRAVISLDSIGAFPKDPPPAPASLAETFPPEGPYLTLLGLENSTSLLKVAAPTLSQALSLTVHQAVVLEDGASIFSAHDAHPFQNAGFPTALVGGSGLFASTELPVEIAKLTQVTRALATLLRVMSSPR